MPAHSDKILDQSPCVVAKGLRFELDDGQPLIEDVSLTLGKFQCGLVGKNGSGKTTLIKILVGEVPPVRGTVERLCNIAYLPQDLKQDHEMCVADVLGIAGKLAAIKRIEEGAYEDNLLEVVGTDWDIADRARRELAKLRLDYIPFDRTLDGLSGGEKTRLMLASLLLKKPDFLILDEPTNNLDYSSREALYSLMRGWPGGSLIVSHDRSLLRLMNQIVELSNGRIRIYGGNFDSFADQRLIEDQAAQRAVTAAEQFVKRERIASQRSLERQQKRNSSGKKLRPKSGQAKIILGVWKERSQKTTGRLRAIHERRIEHARQNLEVAKASIRPENRLYVDLSKTELPHGKTVIRVERLLFAYPDEPGRPILKDFSLSVVGPERIAIHGTNGSGKTTLLRLIVGDLKPTAGRIFVGVDCVAYLPQSTFMLDENQTVLDNFCKLSDCKNPNLGRQMLSKFLFRDRDVFKPVRLLSGGERIRLALGSVLSRENPTQLLIIDEPTNYLDLDSIEQLESGLQDYRGALIVVSHDLDFLKAIGIERELTLADRVHSQFRGSA